MHAQIWQFRGQQHSEIGGMQQVEYPLEVNGKKERDEDEGPFEAR